MKRTLIFCILFFCAGFLTHAIFFPDILANGFADTSKIILPNNNELTGGTSTNNDPLVTKVTFDGQHFNKHSVTIGFTRYIQIVNISQATMSLVSNVKELTTLRPYAASEAVQTQCNTKGLFVVADRNNPAEKLVITVK